MSDADTASVTVTAAPLRPARRGNILYVGQIEVLVGGVAMFIDGWTLRTDARGRVACFEPMFRDPVTGELKSVVAGWPPELVRACAEALLTQIDGGRLIRAPMPPETTSAG